jgi:hypothetical protein
MWATKESFLKVEGWPALKFFHFGNVYATDIDFTQSLIAIGLT